MGMTMNKALSNKQIEEALRKKGIPYSAEVFIRKCGISEHIVRSRDAFSAILVAYDRESLSETEIDALFQEKRLPFTVKEFLRACVANRVNEHDALQCGFVTCFLKNYNPKKRLQDQSTLQKKSWAKLPK